MSIADLFRLARRTLRHLTVERSYEPYYSADRWEQDWSGSYDLDTPKEDGHYGALLALVRRYDRGGPILDAGCGDGLFEQILRPMTESRLLAFDYAPAALERAHARHIPNCEFFQADSRTYQPSEPCSVVILNESLYYLEDYLGVMQNLSRGLKPDGVLIVSMYDTLITRRIWKSLDRTYTPVQGVTVRDEETNQLWRIRALVGRTPRSALVPLDPP
jgi:SAM-dependent methyltransferase